MCAGSSGGFVLVRPCMSRRCSVFRRRAWHRGVSTKDQLKGSTRGRLVLVLRDGFGPVHHAPRANLRVDGDQQHVARPPPQAPLLVSWVYARMRAAQAVPPNEKPARLENKKKRIPKKWVHVKHAMTQIEALYWGRHFSKKRKLSTTRRRR